MKKGLHCKPDLPSSSETGENERLRFLQPLLLMGRGGGVTGTPQAEAHAALVVVELTPNDSPPDPPDMEAHGDTSRSKTRRNTILPTTAGVFQGVRTRTVAASVTRSTRQDEMPFSSRRGPHRLTNPTPAATRPAAEGTGGRRLHWLGQDSRARGT